MPPLLINQKLYANLTRCQACGCYDLCAEVEMCLGCKVWLDEVPIEDTRKLLQYMDIASKHAEVIEVCGTRRVI
jgi:hypothetical protein